MGKILTIFACTLIALSAVVSGWLFFAKTSHKTLELKKNEAEQQAVGNEASELIQAEPEKNTNEAPEAPSQEQSEKKVESAPEQEAKKEDNAKAEEKNVSDPFKITDKLVNWGYEKSPGRTIDTVIIHSSYNAVGSDPHGLSDILNKEYKPYGVSPHYIIVREGKVYRLVEDKNIAYHAGDSKMPDGRTGVNNFSIGIEIINTKSESPSQAQYDSLKDLLAYLKGKYKITHVLGHKDIAPGRKDDPWNFDFGKIR